MPIKIVSIGVTMGKNIENSKKKYVLFLILFMLIFLVVGLLTLGIVPGPYQDEAEFQRVSFDYIREGRAFDPFHPESSYLPIEYGRLYLFISGNINTQLGITLSNVRIISLLSLLVSIALLYYMIRILVKEPFISFWLTIAISSSLNFVWLREARPEALGMLFVLIIFIMLLNKPNKNEMIVLCILSAFLIHIHLSFIFFAFALSLIPFLSKDNPRNTLFIFFPICLSVLFFIAILYFEFGSFIFIERLIETKTDLNNIDSTNVREFFGISAGFIDRLLVSYIKIYQHVQYGKRNIIDVFFLVCGIFASLLAIILKSEKSTVWQKLNLFIFSTIILFLLIGRINVIYLRIILPFCYLSFYRAFVNLTQNRKVFLMIFIMFTVTVNVLITSKVLWTSRKNMTSLPEIKQAINRYIPKTSKVLAKESFWFVSPDMNLVGVRDLEYRAVKDSFAHYLNRQGIQYIIDCNDLNINYPSGSPRNFINEKGKVVYYRKFPIEIGNDMLRGQETHRWGVSDTLSFLSIIAVN